MLFRTGTLAFGAFLSTSVLAQAPNTLAQTYPYDRTMSNNGTYFLVPIDRKTVQAALPSNYTLLPNPTSDAELFPNGFPDDMHPVIVGNALGANIEMTDFQGLPILPLSINFLLQGEVYIPFVDRLKDGKTAFQYPLLNLIGGVNGQLAPTLAPVLVGSTQGYFVYPGAFTPPSNAYSQLDPSNNPNEFVANSKLAVLPNPITGPGIAIDVFQLDFFPTANSLYTPHTFHSILNQPLILYTGQCLRNTQYFNNPYANPFMTSGTVTLSAGTIFSQLGLLGLPAAFQGTYLNVGGYAATSENVGFNAEDCQAAANNVDPATTS